MSTTARAVALTCLERIDHDGAYANLVLAPLLEREPSLIVIANRTVDKAAALARDFADCGACRAAAYGNLGMYRFDAVINATSASLAGELPPIDPCLIIPGQTVCYDMMYGKPAARFMNHARSLGAAHAVDGLGMLVEQAAASFELWRGVRPDTGPVLAQLRRDLAAQ